MVLMIIHHICFKAIDLKVSGFFFKTLVFRETVQIWGEKKLFWGKSCQLGSQNTEVLFAVQGFLSHVLSPVLP